MNVDLFWQLLRGKHIDIEDIEVRCGPFVALPYRPTSTGFCEIQVGLHRPERRDHPILCQQEWKAMCLIH